LRTCLNCGSPLKSRKQKHFCSPECWNAYQRKDGSKQPRIRWLDKKKPDFDGWEWLKHLEERDGLEEKASGSQDIAHVEIKTKQPIALVHTGDWHLGSCATDHRSWRKSLEYILSRDDLFIVSLGDEIDCMQNFRIASARAQSLELSRQEDLIKWVYDLLVSKQKIICAGFGNHDTEFAERCWGTSYAKKVKSERVPFFNGMGQLVIKVGDIEYRGAMVHKARFHSFLNPLHGNLRLQQLHFPHVHWIATAHTHEPAYGVFQAFPEARQAGLDFGGDVILIKIGTFKTRCVYSKRWFGAGVIGEPTLVLDPKEQRARVFGSPQDAVTFIEGWKVR